MRAYRLSERRHVGKLTTLSPIAPDSAVLHPGYAGYLRDSGARLVGTDSLNIDDTADLHRPVHSILLRAGIPIVEHLCGLEQPPDAAFRFSAVPVRSREWERFR